MHQYKKILFCFLLINIIIFNLISNQKIVIKENQENIIKVKADLKNGFNFDYYLYVPANIKNSNIKYLLVEPNNSGKSDDSHSFHDEMYLF